MPFYLGNYWERSYRVAQLVWRLVIQATELGDHKPCGKIQLSFGAGFRAMRMLGREAIIVRWICHAKSLTFMAIVGRSSRTILLMQHVRSRRRRRVRI